ncbi:MAG: hypothetical protein AB7O97_01435 [Planctomycetota bacterium]
MTQPADIMAWTGPGRGNAVGDTVLTLCSSNGTPMRVVDDGNTARFGNYSVMTMGNLPAGDYCLVVTAFVNGTQVLSGTYTLDYIAVRPGQIVPIGPLRSGFEGIEPNDPRQLGGSASISSLSSHNQGNLGVGGDNGISWTTGPADYDFWSFRTSAPTTVTLVTGPGSAATVARDTVVFLCDSTMTPLASDDDSGPGAYSRLTYDCGAGLYYVVVRGRGPQDVGAYDLDILVAPPQAPTSASIEPREHTCPDHAFTVELGVRGVPNWPAAHPELPVLGSMFTMDIEGAPANATMFGLLALDANGGVRLDQFGNAPPWCRSDLGVESQSTLIYADANGFAAWDIPIPTDVTFLGVAFEAQAVVINGAGRLWMSRRCTLGIGQGH